MEIIKTLSNQSFISKLKEYTDNVYLVGGIVRDYYLGVESKDIDLVVCNIPLNDIIDILSDFGKVDQVGKSFGVIKFIPFDMNLEEPIDIAIPRVDISNGIGHKDFKIISDPNLPIEEDLGRRDITINSVAVNIFTGDVIDPYDGLGDMKKCVIKATNPTVFAEDPLRLLRVVQFASRFGFDVEEETFTSIKGSASMIQTISGERVMEELDKIYIKGDRFKGVGLLMKTGLFKEIFGTIFEASFMEITHFQNVAMTRTEFYYLLMQDLEQPAVFYTKRLKGDTDTAMGIQALEVFRSGYIKTVTTFDKRFLLVDMLKRSKQTLEFDIVKTLLSETQDFILGKIPHSKKDLVVTGDMLIELKGFKQGKAVGDKLQELLEDVITDKRSNTIEDLLRD